MKYHNITAAKSMPYLHSLNGNGVLTSRDDIFLFCRTAKTNCKIFSFAIYCLHYHHLDMITDNNDDDNDNNDNDETGSQP